MKNNRKFKIIFCGIVIFFMFVFFSSKAFAITWNAGDVRENAGFPCSTNSAATNTLQTTSGVYDYWIIIYRVGANNGTTSVIAKLPDNFTQRYDSISTLANYSCLSGNLGSGNDDEGDVYLNGYKVLRSGVAGGWCDGPYCWGSNIPSSFYKRLGSNSVTINAKDYAGGMVGSTAIFRLHKKQGQAPGIPSVSTSTSCVPTNYKNVTINFSSSNATYYNIMRNGNWITTGYTGTSYTDYNQPKYSDIPYQVQACNNYGCSALSPATYSYSCSKPPAPTPVGQVTLYNDSNYGGSSLPISNPNVYCTQLPYYFNDITSSLRVPSGMNITLWQHGDCTGWSQTYYSDSAYVGNYYNDQFSAYGWSIPKPSNLSFYVNSSCDSSDCNYQNNTISFYATNATYYMIKYYNNGWQQLGTSYGNSFIDKIPKNNSRYYLVEAWNSAGYINANPVYKQSQALDCPCNVNTPALSATRNCNDPISNKLSWTNSGIYPAKDYLVHRMDSDNPSWNSVNACGAIPGYAWAYYGDSNKTTYTDDKDLDKNKQYKYCLEAYDNIHTPSYSNIVTVAKCPETTQSIKGVFIAKKIVDNTGDREVKITQDSHVVNNPPPGFNDLFAPLWRELVP